MKKVALETVGCRLNQYDTEKIAAKLTMVGFERVDFKEPADIYIINTCTVTGRADASCRNIISRAARREGSPPVVVIGCYVDSDQEKVAHLNGVDLVVGNKEKDSIIPILENKFPDLFENGQKEVKTEGIRQFHEHNRAWIKIGDGCNQKCSYCIIPSVRGSLVNRPAREIINEINVLGENGYNEVVLTGIHIGLYQNENLNNMADLIRLILRETSIARIRLSSIEPQEVNADLISAIGEGGQRVCRHLHIPLQSGSDRILNLMHRPYNLKKYIEIVKQAKNNIESIVIGADIIVGFPGETDDDFKESAAAAECGFIDYLHVFSYSDRPETKALTLPDKINPELIKKRNSILRDMSDKFYSRALQKVTGNIAYVISEHKSDKANRYWGITDNYLKVLLPAGIGGSKEILQMKITRASLTYLEGDLTE